MSNFFKKCYNSSDNVGKMYAVNQKYLDPKITIKFTERSLKGRVNPAIISKPEFCMFFTILNMNMYPIITIINNSPKANFTCTIW